MKADRMADMHFQRMTIPLVSKCRLDRGILLRCLLACRAKLGHRSASFDDLVGAGDQLQLWGRELLGGCLRRGRGVSDRHGGAFGASRRFHLGIELI